MWIGIAILLLILWAVGVFVLKVAGILIHLLIVLAVIALIFQIEYVVRLNAVMKNLDD